jgi:hypothetical protein
MIIDGARTTGRVLSVAENFRRDPMNRLVKAHDRRRRNRCAEADPGDLHRRSR